MIDRPNTDPRNTLLARFSLPCIKKLTVIGIMGNTQGVNNANSPAPNAIQKNRHSDLSSATDALNPDCAEVGDCENCAPDSSKEPFSFAEPAAFLEPTTDASS